MVAISGGADSCALLRVLLALREELAIELEAMTVDHGLRPTSSAEHGRVREEVERLGVSCSSVSLGLDPGPAVQARARAARYEALLRYANARGCSAIAIGHTRDDQAESVLARLLRGAGVRGLAGTLRRREDGVVRPLLDCERADVRAYLTSIGAPVWVEDPSNLDERYLRVRVRTRHLPTLQQEQPELVGMLAQLADDAAEHRAMVEAIVARLPDEPTPRLSTLAAQAGPVRRELLRRWAQDDGSPLSRAHLTSLERLCLTARGEVRLPRGRVVVIEEGCLHIVRSRDGAKRVR